MSTNGEDLSARVAALEAKVEAMGKELAENQLDTWKGRLEQVELQAELGRMEARDQVQDVLEALRSRVTQLQTTLESAASAVGDQWAAIQDRVRDAIASARVAADDARNRIRSSSEGG